MKKLVTLLALGAVASFGGTAAAADYPPGGEPPPTVLAGGDPPPPSGGLAATGSDTDDTIKIAGGALVAGVGLLLVANVRRRRPVAA